MKSQNHPGVIIIYGPPGSGKGTQAQAAAKHFGFEHFDTGRIIEKTVHNPAKQDDSVIQRERRNYEQGILCTPEWVTEIVREEIIKTQQAGRGLVFSGSPRTLYEAEQLIPLLEELYGKENIYVLELVIKPETTIFRNSHRRLCKQCGFPLLYSPENEKLEKCPQCAGELFIRPDDKPEIIKVRLEEYQSRTKPIYAYLEKRGIKVIKIDGEPGVEEVTQNILKLLA